MHEPALEAVREETEQAFGNLPIPHTKDIVGPTRGDKKGERRIRDLLAGRDWHTLDAQFLQEAWVSFCYLSEVGYRYYLPGLLMRCLDDPSEENTLIHSTLFGLTPSYHSIYYKGEDAHFEYQTSLFDPAQYGAVCSFLGFCFEAFPHYRDLSAQALKWGWNRQEHPALRRSLEFYYCRHHYTYPVPKKTAIRQLVEQIRAGFVDTPYPGDDQLCGSTLGDEPAEQALELRGLDWRTIHPELLAHCYTALSFLTDAGFRYFLPAFMITDLMASSLKIDSSADPVFHLTNGLAPQSERRRNLELLRTDLLPAQVRSSIRKDIHRNWSTTRLERHAAFSRNERFAIIAYLQYVAAHHEDKLERDSINEALENYWLPSVRRA